MIQYVMFYVWSVLLLLLLVQGYKTLKQKIQVRMKIYIHFDVLFNFPQEFTDFFALFSVVRGFL